MTRAATASISGPGASRLRPLRAARHGRRVPRIPLYDNFSAILTKAQRGLGLDAEQLAQRAGITVADVSALHAGRAEPAASRAVALALGLDPGALTDAAKRNWYPEQPEFPRGFAMFNTPFDGDSSVNSYLIWDTRTRLAAAFDTGTDVSGLLDAVAAEKLRLRYVFVTHTDEDHVAGVDRLAETGAEIWASEREPVAHPAAKTFVENAYFHLGELAVKTVFTPGHSPGQTTYFVTGLAWPLAVVGDSLFAGSIGGSATHFTDQWRNNWRKIFTLPADTVLACGHGPLTSLKQERQRNPFFASRAKRL